MYKRNIQIRVVTGVGRYRSGLEGGTLQRPRQRDARTRHLAAQSERAVPRVESGKMTISEDGRLNQLRARNAHILLSGFGWASGSWIGPPYQRVGAKIEEKTGEKKTGRRKEVNEWLAVVRGKRN